MAYYLVRAMLDQSKRDHLKSRLASGEISAMKPFGTALHYGLENARLEADGTAIWEEEDYCRPPLAMERAAVLDTYFTDLSTEPVEEDSGWQRIDHLPGLW
jgi:hypothetical protein